MTALKVAGLDLKGQPPGYERSCAQKPNSSSFKQLALSEGFAQSIYLIILNSLSEALCFSVPLLVGAFNPRFNFLGKPHLFT